METGTADVRVGGTIVGKAEFPVYAETDEGLENVVEREGSVKCVKCVNRMLRTDAINKMAAANRKPIDIVGALAWAQTEEPQALAAVMSKGKAVLDSYLRNAAKRMTSE